MALANASTGKLGQHFANHVATDVGKAKIPTGVTIGETFVVQAQAVQDRGLQIVYMHRILGDSEAQFIGLSDDSASPHATTGDPQAEAVGVVIPSDAGGIGRVSPLR